MKRIGSHLTGVWLVAATGLCSACGAPSTQAPARFRLEGSLSVLMNLAYDEARIRLSGDSLAIDFVRLRPRGSDALADGGSAEAAASEDFVLQLGYRLLGDPPPFDQDIELTFLDENGASRTSVARNVLDDPRRIFPGLRVGRLQLGKAPGPVAMNLVNGEFHVTFENGAQLASGRTVFGSFAAKVVPP